MKIAIGSDEKCCLSIRRTSAVQANEILEAWFTTTYSPNEADGRCLRQVEALEARYRPQK